MNMAGEVGHVVYGARMLQYLGDKVSSTSYWIGTLFADIGHIGAVRRHRTHPDNVNLQTLVGENDFITGMRVHTWIDSTRDNFMRERNSKELLLWHPYVPHALKLLEDEMLYDQYDDWNLIQRALNETHPDEFLYVTDAAVINRWHTILQKYFSAKPDDDARYTLSTGIGLSSNSAQEINTVINRLRRDYKTEQMLQSFWQYLETLLK